MHLWESLCSQKEDSNFKRNLQIWPRPQIYSYISFKDKHVSGAHIVMVEYSCFWKVSYNQKVYEQKFW